MDRNHAAWVRLLTSNTAKMARAGLRTVGIALFCRPVDDDRLGAIFAMSSLSLVPVFFIFIIFQRYLVEGISTTGLKG